MTDIISNSTQCGFIAVLGAPNAGKSTLINQIVGSKVSIVSPKVQTTRQRVLGIAMRDQAQLIFVDTPGIFRPEKRLEKAMVHAAWEASREADIILVLVDVSQKNLQSSFDILEKINQPVILVLNKIDQIQRDKLLTIAARFTQFSQIQDTFMTSALNNDGVEDLLSHLQTLAPKSPWHYPEDQISDLPQRLWAAEITREQLYHKLYQELPYETMVETEAWEEFDNGSVKINQVIYVDRANQKAIILGHRGEKIKAISSAAREEMALYLGRKVHLFVHVKVDADWMNKPAAYRLMGLRFQN